MKGNTAMAAMLLKKSRPEREVIDTIWEDLQNLSG